MSQPKILYISSANKLPSEDSSSFTIYIGDGVRGCKSLSIQDVVIPSSMYSFSPYNNKIYFIEDAEPTVIKVAYLNIDIFVYDMPILCDALAVALNKASGAKNTYRAIWKNLQQKIRLFTTNQGLCGFKILSDSEVEAAGFDYKFIANDRIGFQRAFPYFTNDATTDSVANLNDMFINITCELITGKTLSSDSACDTLISVPLPLQMGHIITYKGSLTSANIPVSTDDFQGFRLALKDKNGFPLDLNGQDWMFSMVMHY